MLHQKGNMINDNNAAVDNQFARTMLDALSTAALVTMFMFTDYQESREIHDATAKAVTFAVLTKIGVVQSPQTPAMALASALWITDKRASSFTMTAVFSIIYATLTAEIWYANAERHRQLLPFGTAVQVSIIFAVLVYDKVK